MKLQTKFIIVGLFSAVMVAVLVGESIIASKEKLHLINTLKNIATITQRHMESDMMHDAMRADVMAGLLAHQKGDYAAVTTIQNDLKDHYTKFLTNLEENQKEALPENIKTLFDNAKIALEGYYNKSSTTLETAENGLNTEKPLAAFNEAFDAMEEENSHISDEIEAWASTTAGEGEAKSERLEDVAIVLSILSIALALFVPYYAHRAIFQPQGEIIRVMQELSKDNLKIEVSGTHRQDEIGDIARSVAVFKDHAIEAEAIQAKQEEMEVQAKIEKRKAMENLANQFESEVQGIIQSVAAAATELYQTAESMTSTIRTAGQKVHSVASASENASHNVQSVASASEEMTASIAEVAQQINKSTQAVKMAVEEVEKADHTSVQLGEAVQRIGNIVELIQGITEQINLLALNATIESARAGEAGKGFAVVANEVKTLAGQTSKATDEISAQVTEIQNVAKLVIASLNTVKDSILKVDGYASAISAAAEEQSSTTKSISSNMQHAAQGTTTITTDIISIRDASDHATNASSQVVDAARMLSTQAETLSSQVVQFVQNIRNG
jgi:methyl-accepting chemotaxis protein